MLRFSPRPNRAHLVKWREWGDAAFEEAKQQDKLIAVFVTAFWCGVCQNMDETTLSDDEIIALLNAFFIPIRVEESQRPDVDLRYTQDGWPSIAFLTPGGEHLFTVDHLGKPAFVSLLARVVDTYREQKNVIEASVAEARDAARKDEPGEETPLDASVVGEIAGMLEGLADGVNGGFGGKMKYLHTEATDFCLYLFETTGERPYLDHALLTLSKIRESRTFNAKDGGFFRYSSRPDWNEPHPEKLLADQASLLKNYLRAYLLTGDEALGDTARGLISYVNTFLRLADKPVYGGCQDYVRPRYQPGARPAGPPQLLSYIDEFAYCDANTRLASAFLDAWWILGEDRCKEKALAILDWLWTNLRAPAGGMFHYWDGEPHAAGLLMDAALLGSALVDAYAVLGDAQHLDRARKLAADIERLNRNLKGGYYDISVRGPGRLEYPMTVLTQNATVASFLTRLAELSGETHYRDQARWALTGFGNSHRNYEAFAAGFGHAVARVLAPPVRLEVRGKPGDEGLRRLVAAGLIQLKYQNLVTSFHADPSAPQANVTLVSDRGSIGPFYDPTELKPDLLATEKAKA